MADNWCFKCKGKREMINTKVDYYRNGVPLLKGTCAECGSKISRIMSKQERAERINRQENLDDE